MTQGVPTPEAAIAAFRAHYLYSGNAAESARKVGLEERTGRDLARRLIDDADFSEARRLLRRTALEELVAMRMRVSQTALDRFEEEMKIPEVVNGGSVTIIDKRPEYGKLVLDAEKNAHNLARFDAEKDGAIQPAREVHITVRGPADPAKSQA